MSLTQIFLKELQQESTTTRKMLALIPNDQYQFKPHQKSMNIQQLSTHIAELPGWTEMVLNTSELDFASSPYKPHEISTTGEILDLFEKNLTSGKESLEAATEEQLDEPWTLRNGEIIYSTSPKSEVIRMSFNQVVHHRAQLGVFLRLLNIPIPGSYGPSADELI